MQPVNFEDATTYGLEGMASAFPTKFWSMNISVSLYQQLIDGSNINSDLYNNLISRYSKIINNFSLWKGSKLLVLANYNALIATPQGTRIAVYFVDGGFQQEYLRGKE